MRGWKTEHHYTRLSNQYKSSLKLGLKLSYASLTSIWLGEFWGMKNRREKREERMFFFLMNWR